MVEGETTKLQSDEVGEKIERWAYETRFKSYLYRISILGNRGVESISNFPSRIELNAKWHEALERIKAESRDGMERWVPVGLKEGRALDFTPETSVKGFFTQAETLTDAEIKQQYGIVHLGGDIHSHPSDWLNRLGVDLIVSTKLVKDFEGFSDVDLYRMIKGNGLPMAAVVEKSNNYFAFRADPRWIDGRSSNFSRISPCYAIKQIEICSRTTETRDLPTDSPLKDKMAFSRHWSGKYGGYYLGNSHLSFWALPNYSVRETNMGIAGAFNIALYRGKPGEDLVREYP